MKRLCTLTIAGGIAMAVAASPIQASGRQASSTRVQSCANLSSLALPHTTITTAALVEPGAFIPPGTADDRVEAAARTFGGLPSFCRVVATLRPSSDSDIQVEVWLPASTWNGKYQAVGNGAFTGSIGYNAMAAALALGYATSSTDTGHLGNTASFGLGHPEKVIDFGWRSMHEMTVMAKSTIDTYYDQELAYSYWNGCSAGGRQALMEAQRFPEDFDGIIAGSPGNDWTSRAGASLRVARVLEAEPARRLSPSDRQLVHSAAVQACDASDGVTDGVIGDPESCKFDPSRLQCSAADGDQCLSAGQVNTVRLMYASPTNPQSGRAITGLFPGSELGWTDLGWTQSARSTGLEQFRYLTYADPDWTVADFDFETDIVRAEEVDNGTLNALDPNLEPFFDRGGKLISYHGWADPQISPGNATEYYSSVVDTIGDLARVQDSYRLFMAPGMGHCGGGEGPSQFDMLTALENWVERGAAPDRIVASRTRDGVVDRTRPLCPYPQQAVYTGSGSTDDAANFRCEAPRSR